MELTLKTKKVKFGDIKPYENNPRINKDAVKCVKKSIESFGYRVGIIVDGNNEIIAGHTRYKALKEIGIEGDELIEVVDGSNLTENQVRAFRIADNKSSEKAEWDYDKLAEEINILSEDEYDLRDTLFTEKEVEQLIELSDSVFDNLPKYEGETGKQIGERYALVFYFDKEEDKEAVEEYFKGKVGVELDTEKLLDLISCPNTTVRPE